MKPGSWWLESKSDPRWNASGHSFSVGGFTMPPEVRTELERLDKEINEPRPLDLEWGYMKD
jgi:hypothetical protein